MSDYDETILKMIMEYMDKVKDSSHNAPLPYVKLLTKVFEYFKVLLEDEKCTKMVDSVINKEKL